MNLLSGLNKKISRNSITRETGKPRFDSWVYWPSNTQTRIVAPDAIFIYLSTLDKHNTASLYSELAQIYDRKVYTNMIVQFFSSSSHHCKDRETL